MKLLFLIFHGFDEANGISKKSYNRQKHCANAGRT